MKTKLLILAIALLGVHSLKAQLNIGSSSAPDGNAILQLTTTNKGLLLPRVALVITTSSAPLTANVAGMVVYNTATVNDVKAGIYINDGTKWAPLNTATTQNASYTSNTINCGGTLSGTYSNGLAMDATDTKVITITAATAGAYTASTNTLNGVSFAASGTLLSTGANTPVTLVGTGTPAGAGNYTYTASLGGQTCTFIVPFAGGGTFNCSGATQVQSPVGSLTSQAYTGSYTIPYTSGNGTNYASTTESISGLTLTRVAGTYTGSGSIVYNLSGTYSGAVNGTVTFTIPECTTITFGDAIRGAMASVGCASCTAYDAAAVNDWVQVTSAEYAALQNTSNINGSLSGGATNALMSSLPTTNILNGSTVGGMTGSTLFPASSYIIAFSYVAETGASTNTTTSVVKTGTSQTSGYTNINSVLPAHGAGTGTTPFYFIAKRPNTTTAASSTYLGLYNGSVNIHGVNSGLSYYYLTSNQGGGNSTFLNTSFGYTPAMQGISTTTKQW